jgi:orotate phosphoribosyltransferase
MNTTVDATLAQEFVQFAVGAGVLRFGEFKTKAGRLSPYFFNAGAFDDGAKLGRLAEFYARRLLAQPGFAFDMAFGPAYKGITLAAALAIEMARRGRNLPFAFNRKEAKDHGEGGSLVGAPLAGRVLIVEDVISAGTSVRESVGLIQAGGAKPAGVLIALDRQERVGESTQNSATQNSATQNSATQNSVPTGESRSAVQFVEQSLQIPVLAVATLADLLRYLRTAGDPHIAAFAAPVAAYRERYGV